MYVCGYAEGWQLLFSHTLISSGEIEKVERKSSNVYSYFVFMRNVAPGWVVFRVSDVSYFTLMSEAVLCQPFFPVNVPWCKWIHIKISEGISHVQSDPGCSAEKCIISSFWSDKRNIHPFKRSWLNLCASMKSGHESKMYGIIKILRRDKDNYGSLWKRKARRIMILFIFNFFLRGGGMPGA